MELSEEIFNQIHAYLQGEGNEAERQAFARRLDQEPDLAEEVALQRRIKAGLKTRHYRNQFKAIYEQLKAEGELPLLEPEPLEMKIEDKDEPASIPLIPWWRYAGVAAAILLAGYLAWNIYQYFQPSGPEMAKDEQPKVDKTAVPDTTKAGDRTPPTPEVTPPAPPTAEQLFAQAFSPQLQLTNPLSGDNLGVSPSRILRWEADSTALYAGIRLLQQGRAAAAVTELDQVTASTTPDIAQHAQWYRALALLKQNKLDATREQLGKITADGSSHLYYARASELLRQLTP